MRLFLLCFLISSLGWSKVLIERLPEGALQPQALTDSLGVLHLIYMNGKPDASDIWYTTKKPGAVGFSRAIRVNSQSGSAMAAGTIRGARLSLGKNGRAHVVWNGAGEGKTPLLYSRLDPSTGKFDAQKNVISKAYGLDGGATVASDQQGRVYVSWSAGMPGTKESDRKVWVAASHDDGATFDTERLASQAYGACGCCGMGSSTDAQGNLYVLYRAATKSTQRGMHLIKSKDGALSFSEEKLDDWELNACPMSSASFSQAGGLLGAWERDSKVYVRGMGALTPAPAWSPEIQEGAKHPSLAQSQGRVLLAWAEGSGWARGGSVAWQEFDQTGKSLGAVKKSAGMPAWSMPAAVAGPGNDFTILY